MATSTEHDARSPAERWAHFRFSVVGALLAAPPPPGGLELALQALASKRWTHPFTGETVGFEFSTIERWYYLARKAGHPVDVLRKKVRCDKGRQPSLSDKQREFLRKQHREHGGWTVQLHHDNLVAAAKDPAAELGMVPSYPTVRRFMRQAGLGRGRVERRRLTAGERAARARLEALEVRSYEADRPGALWHLDFHHGKRLVLAPSGEWEKPYLLCVLDDHSRLGCHAQWYLAETAQTLVHGFSQATLKHDRPVGLMSDNGAAMVSQEFTQGLPRLGIHHQLTLPHSPYQNGKQESFWVQVEGRLMPMLEGVPDLTLDLLNQATTAWIERGYNRKFHSEIGQTPLERYLAGEQASRPAPSPDDIRFAFTASHARTQRKSDGTVSIEGRRFEVPSRFRHLKRLTVRYARWDISRVWLVDPDHGTPLCSLFPVNKVANASGRRRRLETPGTAPVAEVEPSGVAPLLKQLMAEYAATGLPPAYLPFSSEAES